MSDKPALLFLVHRIPYPPDKGDKIRSFHLLKHLSQRYSVYLATFVDDPNDWQFCSTVRQYCTEALFVPLPPVAAHLRSLWALAKREPLSTAIYRSPTMGKWVQSTVQRVGIERALVFCSPLAQYVLSSTPSGAILKTTIVDFVDIDSLKWRQYAKEHSWPKSWIFKREACKLARFEAQVAADVDSSFFVSSDEARQFEQSSGTASSNIGFFSNGVDSDYFCPDNSHVTPFCNGSQCLVFTGAMDYWPNIDAVVWFANEVYPRLRDRYPRLEFWIVGGKPASEVTALAQKEGVTVTGRVADVRPYLQYALAAVAPMRVARGLQNKVLEAMAMSKPVLVSPQAQMGIAADDGVGLLVASDYEDYERQFGLLFDGQYSGLGLAARDIVQQKYSWEANLAPLTDAIG
ncbi:TIGR03087 family PEP-CTERM/XrtA system glycosyltransferase [bacterium]|nr:TIGR03087 family PEP-CTERM/XrtA system glycosyltransferase [bacterium]